ncbi:hypothetical protein ACOMHN_010463 [Nucella lapillus]
MDLLTTFDLTQAVKQPTHEKGHILDWFVHRSDDSLVGSTVVSHDLTSDHFCVISQLNVSLPPPQPKYIMARNLKAVDRCALKQDLTIRLSSMTSSTLTASALDSAMTSVLDDHTLATRRKVSARCDPWFSTVAEHARTAKQHKRQMERQWKKHRLTVYKQLFNHAKKAVTKIIHHAKCNKWP